MEARRESATAGMTTNSVVVTVEGVERVKVTVEGMEQLEKRPRCTVEGVELLETFLKEHRGGRVAVGGVPYYTVVGVELLEASFSAPWMTWRRRALRKRQDSRLRVDRPLLRAVIERCRGRRAAAGSARSHP